MKLHRKMTILNATHTNYKVYAFEQKIPLFGKKINDYLFLKKISDAKYKDNTVRYVRKWARL